MAAQKCQLTTSYSDEHPMLIVLLKEALVVIII